MKPKKYKYQSLIGQKGINLIEQIVLEMGFVWNPTNLEAGIDGTIEIRDTKTEDATNLIIQVQSKATERPFTAETEKSFEFICDKRDLDYWLKGNCPVVLVCSNVIERKAYWVSIKHYFVDSYKRKLRKVIFDKTKDVLSSKIKDQLIQLAVPENSGIYFSPTPKREKIYSNLLRLISYPKMIFVADTEYRKNKDLWGALNELKDRKGGINKSWILDEGRIFSFNDLARPPWPNFILDQNKARQFYTDEWAKSEDLNIKRSFVQLLNHTFETFAYHKGLLHKKNDKVDLYYFRPLLDDMSLPKTRQSGYNRLGRNSRQTICDRYYRKSDPSTISYFRHLAFEIQFYRFSKEWHLELTPTYFFTHDGFKIHRYYESKLKGKKGLDKPETVFSETLFWADIITRGSRNNRDVFSYSLLEFDFLFNTELQNGIDDDRWLEKEDEEKKKILSSQIGLFDYED